jgi:hypothetical protein
MPVLNKWTRACLSWARAILNASLAAAGPALSFPVLPLAQKQVALDGHHPLFGFLRVSQMMMMRRKIRTITLITISQKLMVKWNTSTMSRTSTRMKIKTFTNISFIFLLLLGSTERSCQVGPLCKARRFFQPGLSY